MDMQKEFKAGKTIVSRELLETLPLPFDTENVTDITMQAVADKIEKRMKYYYNEYSALEDKDDRIDEKFWEILEDVVIEFGIPYHCDEI